MRNEYFFYELYATTQIRGKRNARRLLKGINKRVRKGGERRKKRRRIRTNSLG